MGESIAITSGKGGVGKSSTIIGIGMILAQMGYRVCMIDMDLGLKNLDVMMGLQHRVLYDLKDVMDGKCTLSRAILQDKQQDNLYLIPACKTIHIASFQGDHFEEIVQSLKQSFHYVLLDTPAGMESGFLYSIRCVNKAVLVTTLDVTSLQDCDRIIGILMKEGMEEISFVVNRMNVHLIEKGISVPLEEAKKWLSVEFLGYVFDDEEVMRSNNHGTPVVLKRDTLLYSCYYSIVKNMLGERVELPKYKEKSLLQKLFG